MAGRLIRVGVVMALLGLAGCAADPELDPDSVESGLGGVLFPADPSIARDITCPEPDVESIAQSLVCTATLHDEPITIDVTIADDGASAARVREPLFDLSAVERQLAARLADDTGVEATVDCPESFVVDQVGITFECTATHDTRPLTFRGEIVDHEGNWTVTFVP